MSLNELKSKYSYHQATPVMQQYFDIKFADYDCLILFQLGDFYELFYEDAALASQVLGIALTKRGKSNDEDIPMCGIPYHALNNYLSKLIEAGYKVAICDQLETPEEAKKRGGHKAVVKRGVTRIITPGTIIEESLIVTNAPNYLASLATAKQHAAICYVDLSTSEIAAVIIPENEIINEIARLSPRELLLSERLRGDKISSDLMQRSGIRISYQVESAFAVNKCTKIIQNFYNILSVKAIGELDELQISAIGSILEYLSLTQKQNLPNLPMPKIVNYNHFMTIDAATRRNLEITHNLAGQLQGSLLSVIDRCITKAGSRLLYTFLATPLIDNQEIANRLQLTEFFYANPELVEKVRKLLKKTGDIERCITRISMNRSSPRDLLSIKYTLSSAIEIKGEFFNSFGFNLPSCIDSLLKPLSGDEELYQTIDQSIREDAANSVHEGNIIKPEYHPKIQELHDLLHNSRAHITRLKDTYQKETKIDNLKILHNNLLGLFIEVTSRNNNKIDSSKFVHRQTTSNTVRYTTEELQKLESSIVNARHLAINLEGEIYNQICGQVVNKIACLKKLADSVSMLDVFCSLGMIASEYNYAKPLLTSDGAFEVTEGRHPVIERALRKESKSFTGNSCQLFVTNRIWLITGPNMAGKSTFLRQNALIAILAQIGSFVPASYAKMGIVDKIFSRIGAGDDLLKGQSTFLTEMLETSAILAQATKNSLVILDEIGRGTSTYDGVAIAWAVLEYLHNDIKCRALFATHYHELTKMSSFLHGLKNYNIVTQENNGEILFLHSIVEGNADKSYGVHVAQLAGLPSVVITRANQILMQLEKRGLNQTKEMLRTQSSNLELFSTNQAAMETKYTKLLEAIKNIEPDHISPKEALEIIYKLKNLV